MFQRLLSTMYAHLPALLYTPHCSPPLFQLQQGNRRPLRRTCDPLALRRVGGLQHRLLHNDGVCIAQSMLPFHPSHTPRGKQGGFLFITPGILNCIYTCISACSSQRLVPASRVYLRYPYAGLFRYPLERQNRNGSLHLAGGQLCVKVVPGLRVPVV